VLTVHDLIPLQIEDYFSYSKLPLLSKYLYLSRLNSSIGKADRIITVSGYTKSELVKRKVSPNKISVIHSGVNLLPKPSLTGNISGDYILNNGGLDIRKNTDGLIMTFADVHKAFPKMNLVITGDNPKFVIKLKKLARELGLLDSIIFTGYVSEKNMATLIKNAKCLCYPSLVEGFGFPVLEAFSLGTPVVTSNTSSLPEIAGNAALLVNPEMPKEISGAIIKILNDDKLSLRLKELGHKQVKKFSWKKAANEYLDLYNSI
jgi:glycosyltransferase involved in cell wall biosynthesis